MISSSRMNDELDRYLASLERSSKFNVIRTLKSTPHETTELVEIADPAIAPGPYIRKQILLDAGLGQAYTRLYEEQQAGTRIDAAPFVFECYATENSLNVVMEFVQGKTLADWIYEVDPSPAFAAYVFPKICDAVSELHEGFDPPIIHRDLKPSNVMISSHGVKVIDFGIARTYREDAESDTRHFGTPSYAPPEQFGFGQTDERSDIYALGMLLYYCLTERTPTFSMLESEFEDDDVPIPLRKVITKATSFDPTNRYDSVRELKQTFLSAIDETLALAPAGATRWKPPSGLPAVFTEELAPPDASTLVIAQRLTESSDDKVRRVSESTKHAGADEAPQGVKDFPQQGVFSNGKFTPNTSKIRIPKALSYVWNTVVLLAWLLMIVACWLAAFQQGDAMAPCPTWPLVLEYPVFMGGFFTFIAYALLHKEHLRRSGSMLAPFSTKRGIAICVGGAFICFAAAVVVQGIVQSIAW